LFLIIASERYYNQFAIVMLQFPPRQTWERIEQLVPAPRAERLS
jgi:hypothetical protein